MNKIFPKYEIVLGLVVFIILSQGCSKKSPTGPNANVWSETTAHAAWSPRYGMGGAVFNNEMWIVGGAEGVAGSVTNYYGGVFNSSNGSQWTQKVGDSNTGGFGERYSPGVLSFNNLLWVIGGNQNGTLKNDVWSSLDGVNWSLVTANGGFTPREDFISIVYNGAMYVIGGWDGGPDSDIWVSNNAGNVWTKVVPVVNTAAIPGFTWGFRGRWGSAATVFNGLIWIFEGDNGNPNIGSLSGTADDDEWTFDGANLTLVNDVSFTGNGSSPMVYHQLTANNGLLWLTPGSVPGGSTYYGYYTSSDGVNWAAQSWYYQPRCGHTALSFNNQDWIMGGYNNQCLQVNNCAITYYNDVWHSQ